MFCFLNVFTVFLFFFFSNNVFLYICDLCYDDGQAGQRIIKKDILLTKLPIEAHQRWRQRERERTDVEVTCSCGRNAAGGRVVPCRSYLCRGRRGNWSRWRGWSPAWWCRRPAVTPSSVGRRRPTTRRRGSTLSPHPRSPPVDTQHSALSQRVSTSFYSILCVPGVSKNNPFHQSTAARRIDLCFAAVPFWAHSMGP